MVPPKRACLHLDLPVRADAWEVPYCGFVVLERGAGEMFLLFWAHGLIPIPLVETFEAISWVL